MNRNWFIAFGSVREKTVKATVSDVVIDLENDEIVENLKNEESQNTIIDLLDRDDGITDDNNEVKTQKYLKIDQKFLLGSLRWWSYFFEAVEIWLLGSTGVSYFFGRTSNNDHFIFYEIFSPAIRRSDRSHWKSVS